MNDSTEPGLVQRWLLTAQLDFRLAKAAANKSLVRTWPSSGKQLTFPTGLQLTFRRSPWAQNFCLCRSQLHGGGWGGWLLV